jgi:hypothetical protein
MATGWPMKTTYANGDVFSSSDVNDITGTVNLASGAQWAAGKNRIINGDFRVNQRSFTSTTTTGIYTFDRFVTELSGGTVTYTPQNFTAGTAPVAGYEGTTFLQIVTASQSAANNYAAIKQHIESVRTFAGQTVTFSFWAKASSGTPNVGVTAYQNFGSGGSGAVITSAASVQAITTSWARYSFTIAIPSISGKTIGTSDSLTMWIFTSAGTTVSGLGYPAVGLQNTTIGLWGVQLEASSVATAFQTASGTIQGELSLCQRYYLQNATAVQDIMNGAATTTTVGRFQICFPSQMRVAPTSLVTQNLSVSLLRTAGVATGGTFTIGSATPLYIEMAYTHTSIAWTAGDTLLLYGNNANSFYGWSAEL